MQAKRPRDGRTPGKEGQGLQKHQADRGMGLGIRGENQEPGRILKPGRMGKQRDRKESREEAREESGGIAQGEARNKARESGKAKGSGGEPGE